MFKCEKCKKTTAPGEKLHKYPIGYKDKEEIESWITSKI